MSKTPLLIRGMFGLGDNLHQRAPLRILKESHDITLETMWPSVYHDLVGEDFRVVRKSAALRTQLKNAAREAHLFAPSPPSFHPISTARFSYSASDIEHQTVSHTILESMFAKVGIQHHYAEADIRLPIKPEWLAAAHALMATWDTRGKPVMLYRPLTERPEWGGGAIRNANTEAYAEMAALLRDRYFIVSVADLEPNKEWIVGPPFPADLCYHQGELYFELMAAIFRRADLVFTSSGFAAVLAAAVETPCISIQGGFEPASWHADCAKWAPYLAIEPIKPCRCGTSACRSRCDKRIDIPAAALAVNKFVDDLSSSVKAPRAADGLPIIRPETKMLRTWLPHVTLVCVETQMHDLATLAINDAISKVKFGHVLIHTDKPEAIPVPGAEYRIVPNWPDKIAMGAFYYTEAAAPITTSHALLMEWDAGIRDVAMWDPAFLDYDYIGAPWPGRQWGGWDPTGGFTVGNGGFALVSKRLADYVFENRHRFNINTDIGLCRAHRGEFERTLGAKWAPEEVAYRFAFECGPPEQAVKPSFGYHDVFNWHLALPNEETIRRTRLLMANDYITVHTPKLNLLARSAPWIRNAIGPEFVAAEAKCEKRLPQAKHLQGRESLRMLQQRFLQPGVGLIARQPNEMRKAYEAELQRRGLKA